MTIDTIFVCYCEDCEENDGITKPYYMSDELRSALEELMTTSERKFKFGRAVGVEGGNSRRY